MKGQISHSWSGFADAEHLSYPAHRARITVGGESPSQGGEQVSPSDIYSRNLDFYGVEYAPITTVIAHDIEILVGPLSA